MSDSDPAPDSVPSEEEVGEDVTPDDTERRYPSTIGGVFYLLVLLATTVGVGVAWSGDWRLGVRLVAGSLMAASVLRLVLPARDAGMLAVRSRALDCVLLGGVGGVLYFLATTIPNQPT